MISQRQIARMLTAGQFSQVVKRILLNGRCANPLAVQVLCHPSVAEPAAVGLALQRVSELWYRADESLDALAVRLTQFQAADGSVGTVRMHHDDSQVAATAVAVRGWLDWLNSAGANASDQLKHTVRASIERGLAFLHGQFHADSSVENHFAGWAVATLQLGDRAEFRSAVCVSELLDRLHTHERAAMLDDLFSYARAMAA